MLLAKAQLLKYDTYFLNKCCELNVNYVSNSQIILYHQIWFYIIKTEGKSSNNMNQKCTADSCGAVAVYGNWESQSPFQQ